MKSPCYHSISACTAVWLTSESESLQYLDTRPFSVCCWDQNNNKNFSLQGAEGEKLAGLLSRRSSQVKKTNICLINESQLACEASPPRISKQPTPTLSESPANNQERQTEPGIQRAVATGAHRSHVHSPSVSSYLPSAPAHQRHLPSKTKNCESPPKQSSLKWQVTISSTVSQCLKVVTHPAVLVLPQQS